MFLLDLYLLVVPVLFITFQYLQESISGPAAAIVEAGDLLDAMMQKD